MFSYSYLPFTNTPTRVTGHLKTLIDHIFHNNTHAKFIRITCFQVKQENINSIIIGDSIVAGLTQYTNIWNNLFGNRFINLGISGDGVENVLLDARYIPSFLSLKNVVIFSRWYK